MSDYIFSSHPLEKGKLAIRLSSIYQSSPPSVVEFHGKWGSLAVTNQHYNGFLPFENEEHICVVLGAPVLYFCDNEFLIQRDSNTATERIYQRWVEEKKINWDSDLSGPFTILLINKDSKEFFVITDLMSFIPVYFCQKNNKRWVSTHVDALAQASDEHANFDSVSIADFIFNDVVTFPYTIYKNIKQLHPGTIHRWEEQQKLSQLRYWAPLEKFDFKNINKAATELRAGLQRYVNTITTSLPKLAQFISAGEDSRALAGLLPPEKQRDSYIFLDEMNREGKIARKVARAYNTNFNVGFRSKIHYLDILPEATRLIGAGHQYTHAHSLGFDKKFKLAEYPAVFGGFLSDTLLKGHHVPMPRGYGRFPFLPQFKINSSSLDKRLRKTSKIVDDLVIKQVKKRQLAHLELVRKLRPESYQEWFNLYPLSMHNDMPNLYTTRRLFRSYEPFMCTEAVKVAAAVPASWKLNRRLFNRALKPFLKPSKWILHADGRLPYFGFIINMPIQFIIWFYRHIAKRVGLIKGNQGPWGDWQEVFASEEWQTQIRESSRQLTLSFFTLGIEEILGSNSLTKDQKMNLMQVMRGLPKHPHTKNKESSLARLKEKL